MNTEKMKPKKTAILCLTKTASRLGQELLSNMEDSTLYIPARLNTDAPNGDDTVYFDNWETAFREAFKRYSGLVCIMAAGIVVRSLAPLMVSKYSDPAVVVVDEKGHYAISLLSGHIGGANRLADEVARILGGQAVITTATDVQGKTAIDIFARDMDAIIEPPENLKIINRCLAEEEEVNIYSPWPLHHDIKEWFCMQEWPDPIVRQGDSSVAERFLPPAVIVSPYLISDLEGTDQCLFIKPRCLAAGIGCRRGVSPTEVLAAFNMVVEQFNIDKRCIKSIASIDIKADEAAVVQLAEELNVPFLTYSREEISILEGTYQESDWVKETIGVGGVCEPAALLATQRGITLVPKQKIGPVTISIAMERSWWLDWDRETGSI